MEMVPALVWQCVVLLRMDGRIVNADDIEVGDVKKFYDRVGGKDDTGRTCIG